MKWYEDAIIVLVFWLIYLPICLIIWYEFRSMQFFDLIVISLLGLGFTTIYLVFSALFDRRRPRLTQPKVIQPTITRGVVQVEKPKRKRGRPKKIVSKGGEVNSETRRSQVSTPKKSSPPSPVQKSMKVSKKHEEVQPNGKEEFEPGTALHTDVDLGSIFAADDDVFS